MIDSEKNKRENLCLLRVEAFGALRFITPIKLKTLKLIVEMFPIF